MTMSSDTPRLPTARVVEEPVRRPGDLSVEELILISAKDPEVFRVLMARDKRRHRLLWAETIAQIIGHVSGLVALTICAVVAWHAFDQHADTEGATIICTGAVSIVGVFVTGRYLERKDRRNKQS
jgi:hypothetical protein